jgi:predicted  nucleic acid-binding Zn-ribbon protein
METNDSTVLVLREIRDEIKGVRQEQQQTNARLESVENRLESVDNRLVTLETSVAHELVEFRKEFVVVRDLLVGRRKRTLPT